MIKAIQTRYKGCHFRSRLEARWAVFFDALSIEWGYEEEGFEKEDKEYFKCELTGEWKTSVVKERYLPDFRIGRKDSGIFVEVKGDKSQLISKSSELNDLHDYQGILPKFNGSLGLQRGLILLGDIPTPEQKIVLHPIMQHRKGIYKSWFMFSPNSSPWNVIDVVEDGTISEVLGCDPECDAKWDNSHKSINLGKFYERLDDAYRSARSARFEHGESGAT